ncbi:GNAT family N-acetyltransferase [Candidatus Bipolaricaulota bacterium]
MANHGIELRTDSELPLSSLFALYTAVGWGAYTNEERREDLHKAVENSSYVVSAWEGEKLVGLARGLSDDVSIFYLQDILVHPEYQRRGIGEQLLQACLDRYAHVRSKVLMTDDEVRQRLFYEKAGFRNTQNLTSTKLRTYIQVDGVE